MADILFDDLLSGSDIYFDTLDAALTAQGAGVEVAATAPEGTAGVSVAASGAGVESEASAPEGEVVIEVEAQGAGVTATGEAPTATAAGYGVVTLVDPINTGPGSIAFFGNFEGAAVAGDIVRYPTTNAFQVLPDGTCLADLNSGEYVCYYTSLDGEYVDYEFTITLVDFVTAWGAGTDAHASAPDASIYGGVNVSGAGVTDAATAPTGQAAAGRIAPGAGVSVGAQAPEATVSAEAEVTGAGVENEASAPEAIAETVSLASGEGAEATAIAPTGIASGDVTAIGAGADASAEAPTAIAVGDRVPGSIPYAALFVAYPRAGEFQFARAA